VRVLVRAWKPSGETAIVAVTDVNATTFSAVPVDGGPVVPLIEVQNPTGVFGGVQWSVRRDGTAIAVGVPVGSTNRRLATVELTSGTARWLTATPQMLGTLAWSYDERSIYFGSYTSAGDIGVSRIAADGSPLASVRGPGPFGSLSSVGFETADGTLVGADEFNGPTAWVRDLATGRERSFGAHYSLVESWRSIRPRALVSVLTRIAAPGAGYLALWDDVDGSPTTILSKPVNGADFEPGGLRIVAAAPFTADGSRHLAILNADGSLASLLAGTEHARKPVWRRSGIVYTTYQEGGPNELRIVSPAGGSSRTLFSSSVAIDARLVTPR
jgi:hypothetical protein